MASKPPYWCINGCGKQVYFTFERNEKCFQCFNCKQVFSKEELDLIN